MASDINGESINILPADCSAVAGADEALLVEGCCEIGIDVFCPDKCAVVDGLLLPTGCIGHNAFVRGFDSWRALAWRKRLSGWTSASEQLNAIDDFHGRFCMRHGAATRFEMKSFGKQLRDLFDGAVEESCILLNWGESIDTL